MKKIWKWILGLFLGICIFASVLWVPGGNNPFCRYSVANNLFNTLGPGKVSVESTGVAHVHITADNMPDVIRILGVPPGYESESDFTWYVGKYLGGQVSNFDNGPVGETMILTIDLAATYKDEPCGPNDPTGYPNTNPGTQIKNMGTSSNNLQLPNPVLTGILIVILMLFSLWQILTGRRGGLTTA